MKIESLKSQKISNIEFNVIKIDENLCAFKAIETSILNNQEHTVTSEGVSLYSHILKAQQNNELPLPDKKYIRKNSELLELVRIYGHPSALSKEVSFNDFYPLEAIQQNIQNAQFSFNDFLNDENLNEMLFIHYSNHEIIDCSTGKLCNIARSADNILLLENYYNNYEKMIQNLVERNILVVPDGVQLIQRGYDDTYFVYGFISFTDEEFHSVLDLINVEANHISNFDFAKKMQELNIFGLNVNLKTKEERLAKYES